MTRPCCEQHSNLCGPELCCSACSAERESLPLLLGVGVLIVGFLLALAVALPAGATTSTTAAASSSSKQSCVSALPGPTIYRDGNWHNGYQWKKAAKGKCWSYQTDDAWSTSGQSIRIYYGGDRQGTCVNGKKRAVRPSGDFVTTIQGFAKKGCKS